MPLKKGECSVCHEVFEKLHHLAKHRKEKHPEYMRVNKTKPPLPSASPYERILEHRRAIKEAMLELDAERNTLNDRIKSIDNIQAQYREFTKVA